MKKIQIIGMALVAMFAFSALLASTAFAEPTLLAEWLINGLEVLTLTLVETTGSILLSDTSNGSDVVCKGIFDGSVGPNGEDEITEVLTLAEPKVQITLAAPLLCESGAVCEKSATDVEVAPEALPWHTLLFLMESNNSFLDLVFSASYNVKCLVLGLAITDECTATLSAGGVSNTTGGVTGAEEALAPLGLCSIGGAGTGEVVPLKGNLTTASGGLTVSSEA
jgi:hypothetical protein